MLMIHKIFLLFTFAYIVLLSNERICPDTTVEIILGSRFPRSNESLFDEKLRAHNSMRTLKEVLVKKGVGVVHLANFAADTVETYEVLRSYLECPNVKFYYHSNFDTTWYFSLNGEDTPLSQNSLIELFQKKIYYLFFIYQSNAIRSTVNAVWNNTSKGRFMGINRLNGTTTEIRSAIDFIGDAVLDSVEVRTAFDKHLKKFHWQYKTHGTAPFYIHESTTNFGTLIPLTKRVSHFFISSNTVFLFNDTHYSKDYITIHSALGKKLHRVHVSRETMKIDIASLNLQKGVYFVSHIQNGFILKTLKVVRR